MLATSATNVRLCQTRLSSSLAAHSVISKTGSCPSYYERKRSRQRGLLRCCIHACVVASRDARISSVSGLRFEVLNVLYATRTQALLAQCAFALTLWRVWTNRGLACAFRSTGVCFCNRFHGVSHGQCTARDKSSLVSLYMSALDARAVCLDWLPRLAAV